jgi:hypothetical protein
MVAKMQGYDESYSHEVAPEKEVVQNLRQAFEEPLRDLDHLLALYSLDEFFTGLAAEF